MRKKQNWLWIFLFWLYLFTVLSNTVVFFNSQSPTKIYYQILLSFHIVFLTPYLLNLLAIILDVLAIVPFFNFLNPQKHFLGEKYISPTFWKWFFAIRFTLLFLGRGFERQELRALFQNDLGIAVSILAAMLLLEGPSHVAVFLYAYQQQSKSKIHHK